MKIGDILIGANHTWMKIGSVTVHGKEEHYCLLLDHHSVFAEIVSNYHVEHEQQILLRLEEP